MRRGSFSSRTFASDGRSTIGTESALAELHRRDEAGTFFAVILFYLASGTVAT